MPNDSNTHVRFNLTISTTVEAPIDSYSGWVEPLTKEAIVEAERKYLTENHDVAMELLASGYELFVQVEPLDSSDCGC